MRLPFLQLESDIIAHGAAEVSHLARCSIPQALGHIAMVRAWVVSHATDEAPPDGWIEGDSAGRRIEAAAHWTGDKGALLQALADAGHVREEPGGIRVLHLEPYVQAWEKNRTAKERMRTLRERSANKRERSEHQDDTSHERSAKFGQQTQTHIEETSSAVAAAPPLVLEEVAAEKPKKPRKEATGPNAELWRALEAEYESRMGARYVSSNGGADATTVSWLLANTTPPEAIRRWGLLLEWSKSSPNGYPTVNGFVALRTHWNAREVVGLAVAPKQDVPPDKWAEARKAAHEKYQRERAAKAAGGGT